MSESLGCIYLITNLLDNKKYIGQHNTTDHLARYKIHIRNSKNPKYKLHLAMKKYGVDNFICEKLCECLHGGLDTMECYYAEQFETYTWDTTPGYNMVWCGNSPRRGIKHTSDHNEKIRQSNLGKKMSPEAIEKIRQGNLGKKLSPETKEKTRQANLGKKLSPETKEKMRQSHLCKKLSLETKEKMRQSHLGKKMSPEAIEKIRQGNLGKKLSPEAIEKMRQAKLGKKRSPEAIAKRIETMKQNKLRKISEI